MGNLKGNSESRRELKKKKVKKREKKGKFLGIVLVDIFEPVEICSR
jgi:hypothetical protein